MTDITIDTVEKNTAQILQIVGKDSFVNWDQFTQNSGEVAKHIDELTNALNFFRDLQHKNFIQTMKKLKGYDLPDILQAVQNKKLPKQALRGVLGRFKLNGEKLELIDSVDSLKESAQKQFEDYSQKNNEIVNDLKNFTQMINKKIDQSGGMKPEKLPQLEKIKSTVKFSISEDAATKLASGIEIQYLTGTHQLIGLKTYKQLIDLTFNLIVDQYKNLTTASRAQQRESMDDHPKYFKILNEYLNNSEALVSEGQRILAAKIGLTEEKLGQSQMCLMEKGMGNQMLMVQTQLRAKMKQCLRSEQDVPVDVAKEVIRYQVQTIETKGKQINSVLNNMQKGPEAIQMVPMVLALILNDYVFKKYGYEEEDFMKNLGESIMTNQQFIKIFKDMEKGIMNLMQKLDVIPPEVAEMMKQQQQMMEQMGGMMPPGMGMPGMGAPGMGGPGMGAPGMGGPPQGMGMPGMGQGTNPFDMLQNQQLQQMQQMFQNMQPPK